MPIPTMREEYAELMKHNACGHFLYTPQRYKLLHPGSVGWFDKYGFWNEITDVSQPGRPEKDGFTGIGRTLELDEPTDYTWRTVSSGSEAETSFGLTGGLSGMLAAAPVDVGANAKHKVGSSGAAALVTTGVVQNRRFKGGAGGAITKWVKSNGKALMRSDFGDDIREYGLWVIHTTWSTSECAIRMTSAHHRDSSAGLELGATNAGKIGGSGSSLKKLESKGWRSYEATESDQGLVVSFGGAAFRLHSIQALRSNPFKQTERINLGLLTGYVDAWRDENNNIIGEQTVKYRDGFDENGNRLEEITERKEYIMNTDGEVIGGKYFRPVRDGEGRTVGWEEWDKEAEEAKKRKEERRRIEDQDEFNIECETVGLGGDEYDTETVERTETVGLGGDEHVTETVERTEPEGRFSKCCVM